MPLSVSPEPTALKELEAAVPDPGTVSVSVWVMLSVLVVPAVPVSVRTFAFTPVPTEAVRPLMPCALI